jgi:4-aminobutyrate aminotransferase-like enzyme
VLKIRPPLVFKKEHADILVDTLTNILSAWPPFGFRYEPTP